MGLSAPENRRQKSKALLVCSTGESAPSVRRAMLPNHGCERGLLPAQVATRLQKATDRSAASTLGRCRRKWHRPQCVCGSEVALGESRLQGSQASLNSNCQKTGESTFHLRRHDILHARSSSTLSNSTNGWPGWQRRSLSEDRRY
jgi:hypothetical protein